jgi:hypothetical protein
MSKIKDYLWIDPPHPVPLPDGARRRLDDLTGKKPLPWRCLTMPHVDPGVNSGTFYIPYVNKKINFVKTICYKRTGSKYAPLLLIL